MLAAMYCTYVADLEECEIVEWQIALSCWSVQLIERSDVKHFWV